MRAVAGRAGAFGVLICWPVLPFEMCSHSFVYFQSAPYKPASKLALSERARAVGLQVPAETLLFGESPVQPLDDYVDFEVPGLESLLKMHEGMQHIGAHMIRKDARVLDVLRLL